MRGRRVRGVGAQGCAVLGLLWAGVCPRGVRVRQVLTWQPLLVALVVVVVLLL